MNDSTDPARSGDGFDDPTAPAWASPPPAPPTQPLPSGPPVTPPSPYPAPDAGRAPDPWAPVDQPPYPQQPQGSSPHDSSPYGSPPYGQPGYPQQPYGSTPYGLPPYPAPPSPYGAPPPANTALALTIVSAIATLLCCLFCLPSLIIGIVALSKQATDPHGAARLTRWGWIVLGIMAVVAVVVGVTFIGLGAAAGAFDSGSYDYQGS